MIPCSLSDEPPDFDNNVRVPGNKFLQSLGRAPKAKDWNGKDFWNKAKPALKSCFRNRCAYCASWINKGPEVDHFKGKSGFPNLAYEWTNYRLACGPDNKSKPRTREVLDPLDIKENWFRVNFNTGMVSSTNEVPPEFKQLASDFIKEFELNDHNSKETRLKWLDSARQAKPTNSHLNLIRDEMPLVARAIEEYWSQFENMSQQTWIT